MNFFNKGDDDKWKEKYLNLLDQQELAEKLSVENEELLCKTVVRLALIAKGFQKPLDPYIDKIYAAVKSGLQNSQLKQDLEALTRAVLTLNEIEETDSAEVTSLLFDFLVKLYSDETKVETFRQIEKKQLNNEFKSRNDLFNALLAVTEPTPDSKELHVPESVDSTERIATKTVCSQLLMLLNDLEVPFEFEERAQLLRDQLQASHNAASLKSLLNQFVSLLVSIKNHMESEQNDIQEFLSYITDQLTELGLQASDANAASQQSTLSRNKLDQFVAEQMQDLQKTSANATNLDPLKQIINMRLEVIAQQIKLHREQDEQQRLFAQKQLDELSCRILKMETEAVELKSSLVMAHNKALRDPLTGIGNRISFDERMETEFSRWLRYKTSLSLIIWDIDNFKKINDTFGHKAGDKTLKIIAQLLSENCRNSDFLCRFGGEEFTMLLPNTDSESALTLANKLRMIIERTRFLSGGKTIEITISCGISDFKENDVPETVFERADRALYEAKNNGRNQCIIG
ncbi:GGDEF domain-containing protein [Methylicorpusculum sp.]|uniref:GGDEF domain-containing protein n=1 Tax=Methylicorpusculum sp. TaxID=2713644 RepID=UPI00271BF4C6|nr:diguanylate cyclase [Methylicorpusculum sp.]MDO8845704.1 diguanylate cyclase [Methylicorpusculum sp.]MDP2177004.1 diguanylate cyclase [Methylicorpusculum sp.]MDP3527821.1 diguanylate cyclase [Methylicorpusculum sp.]